MNGNTNGANEGNPDGSPNKPRSPNKRDRRLARTGSTEGMGFHRKSSLGNTAKNEKDKLAKELVIHEGMPVASLV